MSISNGGALHGISIDVYKPADGGKNGHQSSAAFTIPQEDVKKVEVNDEVGRPEPKGSITVFNDDAQYTEIGTSTPLDVDDKLVVYSHAENGDSLYGGTSRTQEGTFLVTDWHATTRGPNTSEVTLTVSEYVFGCLAEGLVYYGAEGKQLAGTSNSILNEVLGDRFPWLDTSAIETFNVTADYMTDGKKGTKVVDELANLAASEDIPTVVYGRGNSLVFKHLDDIMPVTDEAWEINQHFHGTLSTGPQIQNFINNVRMSGGIDNKNIDDQQTDTSGGTVSVTQSNKLITQVQNRKSELVKIEIYTSGNGTSDDGLRVRIQASNSDNSGPIAPNDTESDLITSGARKVALDDNGWTTFNLGQHDIPRQPWLIIDSPGESGYGVNVASDGTTPAYKVHFPKPILAEVPAPRSLNQYLQHDTEIQNKAIITQEAARQRARSELTDKSQPALAIDTMEAKSQAAYDLRPGDVVSIDEPTLRAQGDFLVTKRSVEYSGTHVKSTLDFESADYEV